MSLFITNNMVEIKAMVNKTLKNNDDENTSDVNAFLDFIEQDMKNHPELIKPISKKELEEMAELVEGVEI